MNKAIGKLIGAAAVAVLLVASCTNSFSSSKLSGSAKDTHQEGISAGIKLGNTSAINVSATLNAAADQRVTITFNNAKLDSSTNLTSALTIYNLANATETDGAPTRGTTVSYTVQSFQYINGDTEVVLAMNLTTAAARLELFIDPTVLTANDETLRLDVDGDEAQGEDNDDDFYSYLNVTGGTAASGASRTPRALFPMVPGAFPPAVGSTTYTINYSAFATDTTNYTSLFAAALSIQKLDYATGEWNDVATSSEVYTPGTGDFVMTFPVTTAGETYRVVASNIQSVVTTPTFNGYVRKAEYNHSVTTSVITTGTVTKADQVVLDDTTTDIDMVTSFTSGKNGYVRLTLDTATIGTEGIDSTTLAVTNFRIYDVDDDKFIEINSVTFDQQNKDQVTLWLNPAYESTGNDFYVYIGPGVKVLGDTTATTDDLYLGDVSQITEKPYGFVRIDSTNVASNPTL